MAVKQFIKQELDKGKVVIIASLDVKRAFDAALRKTTSEREEEYYHLTLVPWKRTSSKAGHKGHIADPAFGTYNITSFLH
jgi:hypothetical protein